MMGSFISNFVLWGVVLLASVAPASAESKSPTQAAMERAHGRILEARREGLSIVHTATELIVEGDRLCVTDFTLVAKNRVRESNRECFTVKGAYDKRKVGLSKARLSAVRQQVLSYPTCGKWSTLVASMLQREAIFPELQQLVVQDALVRGYVLRVIVGHKALFYDSTTKGLKQC
jgi:hypothetical protein